MRVLIVAATEEEVGGLKAEVESRKSKVVSGGDDKSDSDSYRDENSKCEILTTGVGMVATAFALGKHLANNQYDLAINLGIAGSFDREIALGEVVEISQDTIAELGAEDDNEFLVIDKLGFGEATYYPSTKVADIYNLFNNFKLKSVTAITVNTVHGNEASIHKVAARLDPQLESMEGAAFFYACKQFNVASIQIRAVSNYVEKRNRDAWKIGLAIKNLNTFALELVEICK